MTDPHFTIENLRKLMAVSPAYSELEQSKKDNIEAYIKDNNTPVLLYIYQQLREESDAHQIARENLAKNTLRLNKTEVEEINETVKKDFSEPSATQPSVQTSETPAPSPALPQATPPAQPPATPPANAVK